MIVTGCDSYLSGLNYSLSSNYFCAGDELRSCASCKWMCLKKEKMVCCLFLSLAFKTNAHVFMTLCSYLLCPQGPPE